MAPSPISPRGRAITALLAAMLFVASAPGVHLAAQTSAPTGETQGYDYQQNVNAATLRDHIAIDLGVWIPFGALKDAGDMTPGFGFNIHFWKVLSSSTFVIGSIGNSWMSLGARIQTDSGEIDLSQYSFSASPLLGGIGQAWTFQTYRFWAAAHAGATFVNLTQEKGLPAAFIEDNVFFTVAGTAGGAYNVAPWASILFSTRYVHMFGEDFKHLDFSLGASFQW